LLRSGGGVVPGGTAISPDGTQIDTLNSLSGSVTNGYGTWTFGSAVTPGTDQGPPGPFGTFNYVKLNGKILSLQNVPEAQAIRVDYGGNVFVLTTQNDRWWYQFASWYAGNHFVGSPTIGNGGDAHPPAGNGIYFLDSIPIYSPPYTSSPDGTTIAAGVGSLTTSDGVWTWGTVTSGSASPLLNDVPISILPTAGFATQMTVSHGGILFALSGNGHWFAYIKLDWYDCGTSIPAGPIPIDVTLSTNLNNSITHSPATPNGTVIASIVVTMSDGSPFSGTLSVVGDAITAGFAGISGLNLVVISTPPLGSYGSNVVSATQNGALVSSGPSAILIVVR
jgi:hypothetical protein